MVEISNLFEISLTLIYSQTRARTLMRYGCRRVDAAPGWAASSMILLIPEEPGSEEPGPVGSAFYPSVTSAPVDTYTTAEAVLLLLTNAWSSLCAGSLICPPYSPEVHILATWVCISFPRLR